MLLCPLVDESLALCLLASDPLPLCILVLFDEFTLGSSQFRRARRCLTIGLAASGLCGRDVGPS